MMACQQMREVRASYDHESITVYQAYPNVIAETALSAQTFVPPFKVSRMTWIKPSFLWMAYRCGWASKPNQERVLAVQISRVGFHRALELACLSHFDPAVHENEASWRAQSDSCPVRVQWDPERGLHHEALLHRSLQVGLGGSSVLEYVQDWILSITDSTPLFKQVGALIAEGRTEAASDLLPVEVPYPVPGRLRFRLGMPETQNEGD
jgi:hypothetical protein